MDTPFKGYYTRSSAKPLPTSVAAGVIADKGEGLDVVTKKWIRDLARGGKEALHAGYVNAGGD